jgi:hypothetical protein
MTEQEQRDADGDMAAGCLEMIREALQAIGCKCGPDAHKATPPMMYPEWIGCAVHSAVLAERERCANLAAGHFIPGHSVAGPGFAGALAEIIRKG